MSKYSDQLGINVGTAQNRLVKDILFKFMNDLSLNNCYQCGEQMQRDTFTIEHKAPWRNESNALELFFDLDNIAFSHLKCNTAAARRPDVKSMTPQEYKEHKNKRARERYSNITQEKRDEINKKRRERRARNKQDVLLA